MAVKRNLKALEKLREIFVRVPEHRVHMGVVMERTHCGSAGCLLGWSRAYAKKHRWFEEARANDFGLANATARKLFAIDVMSEPALRENPHLITKAQVLRQLDRVIAGKPIKPYVVKGP